MSECRTGRPLSKPLNVVWMNDRQIAGIAINRGRGLALRAGKG